MPEVLEQQSIQSIDLKPGERGLIVGQTGTGKSVLAKSLLPKTGKLIIIDPKGEFEYFEPNGKQMPVYRELAAVKLRKPARFIFRPREGDIANIHVYDGVFQHAYEQGDTTVFVDEIIAFANHNRYPHYMAVCYQMGRSKRVSILACTQRPKRIPEMVKTESQRFYCFKLNNPEDIKEARSVCAGYDPARMPDYHSFLYYYNKAKPPMETALLMRYILK